MDMNELLTAMAHNVNQTTTLIEGIDARLKAQAAELARMQGELDQLQAETGAQPKPKRPSRFVQRGTHKWELEIDADNSITRFFAKYPAALIQLVDKTNGTPSAMLVSHAVAMELARRISAET